MVELTTKVTEIITRENGSQIKIIVEQFTGNGLNTSVGVYAHHRESPNDYWHLLSNRPHPDWRSMSVCDYIKYGRSELLQFVSPAEILKLSNLIGKSRD